MSIGLSLKKITSPDYVASKFDAIKVPALIASTISIGKPLVDTMKKDFVTISEFFKNSHKVSTFVYKLFDNNNEDYTPNQSAESNQDNQVAVIGGEDNNIYNLHDIVQ